MISLFADATFYHYTALALTAGLSALGVALGQAKVSQATSFALFEQPQAVTEINRVSILALALCETTFILTISVVILSLFTVTVDSNLIAQGLASYALVFAMGVVGLTGGYLTSSPAVSAIKSVARQPQFANKISMLMLVTTLFIQSPILFGFLLCFAVNLQIPAVVTIYDAIPLLSAGICYGLGTIGPLIGLAQYAQSACAAIGRNRKLYRQIFSFSLISQAMIEAPILFVMVLSFALLQAVTHGSLDRLTGLLTAALMMGIGTCAPGIAAGTLTSTACTALADNPQQHSDITSASFIGQVFIDTLPLYCLVLSLIFIVFA